MTRVTISVALIAVETTQNFNASLYCFAVVIIAKLVADSFNIGIYDVVIEMRKIPFLVDDLGYEGYQLSLEDSMTPVSQEHDHTDVSMTQSFLLGKDQESANTQLANIRSVDTLHNVLHLLRNNIETFEFIVNNENDEFVGTIERFIIVRLLEHRLLGELVSLVLKHSQ